MKQLQKGIDTVLGCVLLNAVGIQHFDLLKFYFCQEKRSGILLWMHTVGLLLIPFK